jgi:methionine aminopeptidase
MFWPPIVQPGVATDDIDKAVHQMIVDNGAYPSPLQYGTDVCSGHRV